MAISSRDTPKGLAGCSQAATVNGWTSRLAGAAGRELVEETGLARARLTAAVPAGAVSPAADAFGNSPSQCRYHTLCA
jgi:hypothetical protein